MFCSPRCRTSPALHLVRASQQSYYDVLGVPKDADLKQIKQAFKRKALKLHPDVNTAVLCTLCSERLNEARAKPCLQAGCILRPCLMKTCLAAAGCEGAIHGMQACISGPVRHQAEKPL